MSMATLLLSQFQTSNTKVMYLNLSHLTNTMKNHNNKLHFNLKNQQNNLQNKFKKLLNHLLKAHLKWKPQLNHQQRQPQKKEQLLIHTLRWRLALLLRQPNQYKRLLWRPLELKSKHLRHQLLRRQALIHLQQQRHHKRQPKSLRLQVLRKL